MANLSIREAVKHFHVSRPTLTKSLKMGKVSGKQDGKGQWSIDPAELARVYRPRPVEPEPSERPLAAKAGQALAAQNTLNASVLEELRERLTQAELRAATAETRAEAAETLAKERADRIEDLASYAPTSGTTQKAALVAARLADLCWSCLREALVTIAACAPMIRTRP